MRAHQRGIIAVAAAALLVALTSCANDGGNDSAASGSSTPSSPAPTTNSPTPQTESEKATDAASALVEKYYATVDKLGQDPKAGLDALSTVATSLQLSAQRNVLKSQRQNRQRQTGNTKVVRVKVQSVNLDNSGPKAGKVPTVQIDVCWDVHHVDLVDADGKSVVSSNRPETGWTRLTVANYDYKNKPANGWRVATGQDIERTPCDAS